MLPADKTTRLPEYTTTKVKDPRVRKPRRPIPTANVGTRSEKPKADDVGLDIPDPPRLEGNMTMSIQEEVKFLLKYSDFGPASEYFYRAYGQHLEDYMDRDDSPMLDAYESERWISAEAEADASRAVYEEQKETIASQPDSEHPRWNEGEQSLGFRKDIGFKVESEWVDSFSSTSNHQYLMPEEEAEEIPNVPSNVQPREGEEHEDRHGHQSPMMKKEPDGLHGLGDNPSLVPSSQSKLIHVLIPVREGNNPEE